MYLKPQQAREKRERERGDAASLMPDMHDNSWQWSNKINANQCYSHNLDFDFIRKSRSFNVTMDFYFEYNGNDCAFEIPIDKKSINLKTAMPFDLWMKISGFGDICRWKYIAFTPAIKLKH